MACVLLLVDTAAAPSFPYHSEVLLVVSEVDNVYRAACAWPDTISLQRGLYTVLRLYSRFYTLTRGLDASAS
jgi:hypothetical protein